MDDRAPSPARHGRYLRASAIAELVGVDTRTVRRWIAHGVLPSVRIGGTRLVAEEDLRRLLTAR